MSRLNFDICMTRLVRINSERHIVRLLLLLLHHDDNDNDSSYYMTRMWRLFISQSNLKMMTLLTFFLGVGYPLV